MTKCNNTKISTKSRFKWEIKMKEVNLESGHRNQYIEKARSRSD